jgi:quinolinate synthase
MIRYAGESHSLSFIVGTEIGMLYPLKKANPGKKFYPASKNMLCSDMKKISLDDIIRSLETMEGEVKVPEDIRLPALKAVQRMIDLSTSD